MLGLLLFPLSREFLFEAFAFDILVFVSSVSFSGICYFLHYVSLYSVYLL